MRVSLWCVGKGTHITLCAMSQSDESWLPWAVWFYPSHLSMSLQQRMKQMPCCVVVLDPLPATSRTKLSCPPVSSLFYVILSCLYAIPRICPYLLCYCPSYLLYLWNTLIISQSRMDTPGVHVLCQRSREPFMPCWALIQAPRGVSSLNSSPMQSLHGLRDYMCLMDLREKTKKLNQSKIFFWWTILQHINFSSVD